MASTTTNMKLMVPYVKANYLDINHWPVVDDGTISGYIHPADALPNRETRRRLYAEWKRDNDD